MPITPNREYRSVITLLKPDEREETAPFHVRGYATTFETPYMLYEYEGVKYFEQVDRNCLDGADLSDVIMQFDHAGRVFARTGNGTLQLGADDHGLWIEADLSTTASSRELYEEIKAGLITKMSWAFTVREESYNKDSHTRAILKIKKVYDVSAVSYPANPDTEIAARSFCAGVAAETRREALVRKLQIADIINKIGVTK